MIAAGVADLPEVVAFREARAETAMCSLDNLRQDGMTGEHPICRHIWMQGIEETAGPENRGPDKQNEILPHLLSDLAIMMMPRGVGNLNSREQAPSARALIAIGFQNIGTWTHLGFSSTRRVEGSCH